MSNLYTLGISAFYHDSAAAILKNGEIVAAGSEERFTRKKGDSTFPHRAVEFCLKQAGIAIVNYTGLVYALTIGWIVFGEPQGLMSLVGMLLVVVGILMSVMYGRRQSRLESIEATAG